MKQKGFTLIELIIVIVLLSILAVTALPKYVDLQDEARSAALEGVKAAIQSASAINYAAVTLSGAFPTLSTPTSSKYTVLSSATSCDALIVEGVQNFV